MGVTLKSHSQSKSSFFYPVWTIYIIKIFFLILLFYPGKVCAQDGVGLGDYAISGTIKILAKIFVQTSDLEKVKTRQIKSLSKMKEAEFQKRYTETYNVLKDFPLALRVRFGITEHMTEPEAIKAIRSANKSDLLEMIDKIPDQVIVKHVKNFLRQKEYQLKDKIFYPQIDSLWKKFIQKA